MSKYTKGNITLVSISQYKVPLTVLSILLLLTKTLSKSYTKKIENKKKMNAWMDLKSSYQRHLFG